jgi:tetratricopeptide (TPR) repeat protein
MEAHLHFNQGLTHMDAGLYEQALDAFSEAIALNPHDADVYAARAEARAELEDMEGAIADYTRAIELKPDQEEVHFDRAHARLAHGDLQGAVEDYTRVLELTDDRHLAFGALSRRGLVYFRMVSLTEAIDDFTDALELRPQALSLYQFRGQARYIDRDHQGAIEDFTTALEGDSEFVPAWYERGRARLEQEDYDGAIDDFHVVTQLSPGHPEATFQEALARELRDQRDTRPEEDVEGRPQDREGFLARAEARYEAGDCLGAISDYYRALSFRLEDPHARFGLTMAKQKLQLQAEARVAEVQLQENPRDLAAYLKRADALRRDGLTQEAVAALLEARQVDPNQAEIHFELGLTVSCWGKDPEAALPHFNAALSIQPRYLEALRYRALALRDLKRYDLAVEDFDQVEAYAPADRTIHMNRGLTYELLGDHVRAEHDYTLGLRIAPESDWLYMKRGFARLCQGKHEEAVADFSASLEHRGVRARQNQFREGANDPGHPLHLDPDGETLMGRAVAREKLGDHAGARRDYEVAVMAFRKYGKEARAQEAESHAQALMSGHGA